jgi:hypothetical protein
MYVQTVLITLFPIGLYSGLSGVEDIVEYKLIITQYYN